MITIKELFNAILILLAALSCISGIMCLWALVMIAKYKDKYK